MEIRFEQVSKRFGRKMVLEQIDWQIHDHEIWRIEGASGLGKTTLLRLLMGLERPSSGQIITSESVRFAPVFQENRLLPMQNAIENVRFVCDLDTEQIRSLLCELIAPEDCEQPVGTLSGGMQRRVAIARALAVPADVLVLDEPFTGLDETNIARTAQCILKHAADKTIILSSHVEVKVFLQAKYLRLG